MRKAILDTSFVLTCVRQKIDFFEQFELFGIKVIIPKEVLEEVKKLEKTGKKYHLRQIAKTSLRIIERNDYEEISLTNQGVEGDYVDELIIEYCKKNKELIVAVLDREIKDSLRNPKAVIKGSKRIDIV